MHCFHLSRETWSGVLCSETLIRRIWEDLFLKATRITCSIRRDQTWQNKSFMSSPSISASVNYYAKKKSKDRRYRTAQYGFVESRRGQVRLQEEFSMKEKVLRNTQIRNMYEMGEIKRAQAQRMDEVSVQKLRESHETIQQLTSQLQQLQEQINSMHDSGDFQDVESNYSGRLSHVSSQLVMIPSSRSLLRLVTSNQFGLQQNVFGNQFSTFDPEIILKEINLTTCEETVKLHLKQKGWRPVTQVKTDKKSRHNSNADICDKAVDYEFYNTSGITAELLGRTAKTTNIAIAIRQIPWSTIVFSMEHSFQNPSDYLFLFSIGCYVVDQGSGDGWFFGRLQILAIGCWKDFSKLRDGSEQDHPEFPVQEEGQPRGAESPKRGSVATRKTDRLHDQLLLFMIQD